MQINYHDWFLKSHRYLTGIRDGVTTYNDTKWVSMNKRLETLIQLNSDLIKYQPYNVVGNYTAFKRLMDLMERSNYTFEDMDQSLIQTYKMSLQNAMSSMVVNTHAVIAHYSSSDKKHVYQGTTDHYYIIDVPFDQLHFGDRDEFVRQRLHEFHETENDYFMESDKFLSSYISDILGFTLLCTVNGFITDDWKVAIDEKGFRFKIGWTYVDKADFIIYKLDKCFVQDIEVSKEQISYLMETKCIGLSYIGLDNRPDLIGSKCIFHMCDSSIKKAARLTPNFGVLKQSGLDAICLQDRTKNDIESGSSSKVRLRLYILKYLFELPTVYPMINFYGIIARKHVYDANHNHITNNEGQYILTEYNATSSASGEACTPPICVDRYDMSMMNTLVDAAYMSDELLAMSSEIERLYWAVNTFTEANYENRIVLLKEMYNEIYLPMAKLYAKYLNICVTTDLVEDSTRAIFDEFMQDFSAMFESIQNAPATYNGDVFNAICNSMPGLISDNADVCRSEFVNRVTAPFTNEPVVRNLKYSLKGSRGIGFFGNPTVTNSDHNEESSNTIQDRINRPISEQCFIALRYDTDEACWKFACPNINHFKGISNTFYIRDKKEEGRTFKFMILYTDTANPAEEKIPYFSDDMLMDFDKFMDEVDAHLGYIKYWNVESRLMKLSKMMYSKNDPQTAISILSRILDHKMQSDWLTEYPSIINYEMSNVSSDNVGAGEYEIRAPFALNFMFYTISMLYDNKDQLQSYFLRQLVNRQFHPRYADLLVDRIHSDLRMETVNFSVVTKAPSVFSNNDQAISRFPDSGLSVYNGFPFVIDGNHEIRRMTSDTEYAYVFNTYETGEQLPLTTSAGLDPYYYISFANINASGMQHLHYYDDARIASMMSKCIAELAGIIAHIQTNFKTIWDQRSAIDSAIQIIDKWSDRIRDYLLHTDLQLYIDNTPSHIGTRSMYSTWFSSSSELGLKAMFVEIKTLLESIRNGVPVERVTQNVLTDTQWIHRNIGYDYGKSRYARAVYIHLKKMEEPLSLRAAGEWSETLKNYDQGNVVLYDISGLLISTLTSPLTSDDPRRYNYAVSLDALKRLTFTPNTSTALISVVDTLKQMYEFDTWWNEFLPTATSYFMALMNDYMFDIYAIDDMTFPDTFGKSSTDKLPAFALLTIPKTDPHVVVPSQPESISDNVTMLFSMVYDQEKIVTLHPVCNYAFFDGTNIEVDGTTNSMSFFYADGYPASVFGNTGLVISLKKVASSTDIMPNVSQYIGCQTLPLEVQNVHETFDVLNNGTILNERHANLHYELLAGNRFSPLDSDSEFITNSHSGPHDKLFLKCDKMNRYAVTDMGGQPKTTWYFKPCQVLHIPVDNGYMNALGSGYFEGQTLYAYTDDGLCVFPMIVTAVDHSEEHGMIEAVVDEFNANWFRTSDPAVIEKYLDTSTPITCTIVDDNIRNFMDEYTKYNGPYYPIPQISSTVQIPSEWNDVYTLPGDPIYVVSNSEYVYTRLNWMFHDEIPNRIDGSINPMHHFVYIGDFAINDVARSADIHLLYHDFNPYTTPEMYPVLREEPDDHNIWKQEHQKFRAEAAKARDEIIPAFEEELAQQKQALYDLRHPVIQVGSTVMIEPGTSYNDQLIPLSDCQLIWYVNEIITSGDQMMVKLVDTESYSSHGGPYTISVFNVVQIQLDFRNKERKLKLHIEAIERDIAYWKAFIKRMEFYDTELETPTKWYNVNSYDAAMVYIENGRAQRTPVRKSALRDIIIGEAQIRLYDWEHKRWLSPDDYMYSISGFDGGYDTYDDYLTARVRDTLSIIWMDPTFNSKKILVYVVYNDNTPWSEINPGSMECQVTFKPVMILNPEMTDTNLYHRIRIRKHYDESETYRLIHLDPTPDDFPLSGGVMLTRPDRSGKYKYGSPIRFCDMKVFMNDDSVLTYDDFDIYMRNPMHSAEMPMYHFDRDYHTTIGLEIDGFEPNCHVLLISVRNDNVSGFNGASSNIMFEAVTALDEDEQPVLTITSSTVPTGVVGTFVCTVVPDGTSPMSGGLVNVIVTEPTVFSPLSIVKYMVRNASVNNAGTGYTTNYVRLMLQDSTLSNEVFKVEGDPDGYAIRITNVFTDVSGPGEYPFGPNGEMVPVDYESAQNWSGEGIATYTIDGTNATGLTVNISQSSIQATEQYQATNWVNLFHDENHRVVAYKIIPKQIILVPKDPTVDILNISEIQLKNQYVLDSDGSDDIKTDTLDAPFTYYYDKKHDVRYPIGNVLKNRASERLIIDTDTSTDVSTIKSNHISVCRYASHVIPQDGIIDLTGYIPTPLSRDRYEFWVNGKYVDDPDIIILSPTSFQLRNMTSLHNLEVIELVDDISDTELMPKGPVYIDLNGNTYGSYHSMLVYKANIIDQSIKYQFNQTTKMGLDDYLAPEVRASGNRDYEPDILSYVQIDAEEPTSYNELYHIPTINGQTIFHATTQSLGLMEFTNKHVIDMMDRVWKREILNGVIPITHGGRLDMQSKATQFLHVIRRDEEFEIYTSGTFDRPFTLYISNTKNGMIHNAATTIRIMPMLRAGTHVILSTEFEGKWLLSTVPDTKPVQIK